MDEEAPQPSKQKSAKPAVTEEESKTETLQEKMKAMASGI